MEKALDDFTNVIHALDERISKVTFKFSKISSPKTPVEVQVEVQVEVSDKSPVETPSESCKDVTDHAPSESYAESSIEALVEPPVEITVESTLETPVEPAVEGETLVNLDAFSGDTIQNELWMTFKQISDSGNLVVVTYSGEGPRNIIVYASEETQPIYRNSSSGELRIIQAIEGTLIATLQPGETVKTARVDGVWITI